MPDLKSHQAMFDVERPSKLLAMLPEARSMSLDAEIGRAHV